MYGHYTDQAVLAVIPSENTENAKKEMNENAMVDNIRHDNAKIYLFSQISCFYYVCYKSLGRFYGPPRIYTVSQ